MMLNKRDRNRIYKVVTERFKFDPAEFEFEDTDKKVTITHNSRSTFEISPELARWSDHETQLMRTGPTGRYEYEFKVTEGVNGAGRAPDIDYITIVSIPEWLSEIRETVGAPDFWDELKRGRQLLAEIQQESGNAPFTENERRQIAAQLQEITRQLKEQFELTNEQTERVEEWRDEVVEASTRMGRKDWFVYLLGTITALIIASTVTSGVGEHIITMVIHALGHLFTGGSEPPQIIT